MSLERAQLITPLAAQGKQQLKTLLERLDHGGGFGPELALQMSPGLGVQSLFDQDAREQLLPAELSFEQLRLELAPHPTFLPLGELDMEVSCRGCGDELPAELFERALDALSILPVEEVSLSCRSCDAPKRFKELSFDREVAFASAWLIIEECGSSRLNPVALKAWGESLGMQLISLVDQREASLPWEPELELLGDGLSSGAPASYFEMGLKPSRALRSRSGRQGGATKRSRGKRRGRGGEEC